MTKERRIPRTYGDHTFVSGWEIKRQSYPKDHDAYCPAGGSQHLSTHKRLGTEPSTPFPITETQHMLQQVLKPVENLFIKRPMIGFTSYPYTESPDRNASINTSGFPQFPKDYGYQEYVSTMHADYRPPRNMVRRPMAMANPPYMLNQKVHSMMRPKDSVWIPPHFGIVKFDDDEFIAEPNPSLKLHNKFRMLRCNSYDPFKGKYQLEDESQLFTEPVPGAKA